MRGRATGNGDAHHRDESHRLQGLGPYAADRGKAGAERPDEDRPEIPLLRAEPIDELPGEEVAERIDDGEHCGNCSVVVIRPVEFRGYEVLPRKGQDLPVQVVDGCGGEEHRTDDPPKRRGFIVVHGSVLYHK